MHANRIKYNLEGYKQVLEKRERNFAIMLYSKKEEKSFLYFPKQRSMWHEKFVKAYTSLRSYKMYKRIKINKTRMITLTYDTKLYNPEQVAKRHKRDIKKFMREVRKKYPDFQYTYFIELTKRLYVHFHIYTDQFLQHSFIKQIWENITGSTIVYINLIKNETQKLYTATYNSILKKFNREQLEFAWKHISRFFISSRKFFEKIPEKEPEYIREFIVRLEGEEMQTLKEVCVTGNIFMVEWSDIEEMLKGRDFKCEITKSGKMLKIGFMDKPPE